MCTRCMERLSFLRSYEISLLVRAEPDCDVEPGTCAGTGDASPSLSADQTSMVTRSTSSDKTSCSGAFKSHSVVHSVPLKYSGSIVTSMSESSLVADNTTNSLAVDGSSGGVAMEPLPSANGCRHGYTETDTSMTNSADIDSPRTSSAPSQSDVTSSSQSKSDPPTTADGKTMVADGKTVAGEPSTCFLKKTRGCTHTEDLSGKKGAGFFHDGWRSSLCHCPSCEVGVCVCVCLCGFSCLRQYVLCLLVDAFDPWTIFWLQEMYEREKVRFLCDPEDTIAVYESRGRGNECDVHDAGMAVLTQQLGRVEQVEMIHGWFVCLSDCVCVCVLQTMMLYTHEIPPCLLASYFVMKKKTTLSCPASFAK